MRVPWWVPFGQVNEIQARDLAADLASGKRIFLLDVREPFEFLGGHIRGAKNISVRELAQSLDKLELNRETPVVLVCLSGHRSIPAYRLLRQAGFQKVYSLQGGMLTWRREKLPTTRETSQ